MPARARVALLFERRHPEVNGALDEALYEESIGILEADCDDDAKLRAEGSGKEAKVDYPAASGEQVEWRFVGVWTFMKF